MRARINWSILGERDDPRWRWSLGLYAYLAPQFTEILYLGRSYGCTIRERWNATDKKNFWQQLEQIF